MRFSTEISPRRVAGGRGLADGARAPRQRHVNQCAALLHDTSRNRRNTMYQSLGKAAAATGVSRSTILRAIKAHRISAAKTDTGDWTIDPAELHRVFPPAQAAQQTTDVALTRHATDPLPPATGREQVLEAQIAALRELAEVLRRQLDDVRDDRDHWRGMAEDHQRLLAPPERRSWWRRIVG
jgi:hypothetical protein